MYATKKDDVETLKAKLRSIEVGKTISYFVLSRIIGGFDVQKTSYGLNCLTDARHALKDEHVWFRAKSNRGLVRMSNGEILSKINRENEITNSHSTKNNLILDGLELNSEDPAIIERYNRVKIQTAMVSGITTQTKFDVFYKKLEALDSLKAADIVRLFA